MHIDEKLVKSLFVMTGQKEVRKFLKKLKEQEPLSYTGMKLIFDIETGKKASSGNFAYYSRKLEKCGVIRKDAVKRMYYLTRVGIRLLEVIDEFESHCRRYELDDLDEDGKIKLVVVGRKL